MLLNIVNSSSSSNNNSTSMKFPEQNDVKMELENGRLKTLLPQFFFFFPLGILPQNHLLKVFARRMRRDIDTRLKSEI